MNVIKKCKIYDDNKLIEMERSKFIEDFEKENKKEDF